MTNSPLRAAANVDSREAHEERAARAVLYEAFMRRIVSQRGRLDIGPADVQVLDIAETALLAVRPESGNAPSRSRSLITLNPLGDRAPAAEEATRPGATSELADAKVTTLPISRPGPSGPKGAA